MTYDLYFCCCTPEGGILHAVTDGRASLMRGDLFGCDRPMYAVLSEGRLYTLLRAPFADGTGGLVSQPLLPDGSLGETDAPRRTEGVCPCHLTVWQNAVFCANYLSGSISRIGAEGTAVARHEGKGVHPTRQEAPHTHFVTPSPDGRSLLAVDLGIDRIVLYDRALQRIGEIALPGGFGPRHLVFSPEGVLFCVGELASAVAAFEPCGTGYRLAAITSILPDGFTGESTAAAIRYRDGLIYASNRGHDSIACLRYEGGELRLLSLTPCGGRSPRDFDFAGDLLFCTNESSDSITVFSVAGERLTPLPALTLAAPHPLCVTVQPRKIARA